jgi:hypothetical protein
MGAALAPAASTALLLQLKRVSLAAPVHTQPLPAGRGGQRQARRAGGR